MNVPAHRMTGRRRWPLLVGIGAVVVAMIAGGTAFALSRDGSSRSTAINHGPGPARTSQGSTTTTVAPPALEVRSTSPADDAKHVTSDSPIIVRFSAPVTLGSTTPTLSPAVRGTWSQYGPSSLRFTPDRAMIPYSAETVTVPDGGTGLRSAAGGTLRRTVHVHFTIAAGSTRRLQELLAELHYLPLRFTPSGGSRPARDDAVSQSGTFAWRWSGLPSELTSLWTAGSPDTITKAAVMTFEERNGLSVDGVAGPDVWKTLLRAERSHDEDTAPYTYVLVTKTLPEHLELWDDGAVKFADIAVNTGAPGADTADGTYPVFEHVTASDMSGTNPDGSTYDDKNVPWASFFNGGDALHGFVRASYGTPQSNGCVEMPVATAAQVWPYTPIGTLVTVVGAKVV